jgi:hypothetical protein
MREGLLLSETTLTRTGFRLLALLFAEYEWGELRRDDDPDVLDDFTSEASDLISEDLVALAAMARAQDDELKTLTLLQKVFPHGVGTLISGNCAEALSPREACNKILHARKFRYKLDFSERNPLYERYYQRMGLERAGRFKAPVLVLEGEHHNEQWRAEVDAIPFVIAASAPGVHQWAFA